MEERLRQLEGQVAELSAWKAAREFQQIRYPLDEPSRNTLREAGTSIDVLSTSTSGLTQTIGTAGPTATVPAAYAGTVSLRIGNTTFTVPYL